MRVFSIIGIASGAEHLGAAAVKSGVGFTSSKILPTTGAFAGKMARAAIITVNTDSIRYFQDGTTPTVTGGSTPGILVKADTTIDILGEYNVANFLCINAVDGNNATVSCQYFF